MEIVERIAIVAVVIVAIGAYIYAEFRAFVNEESPDCPTCEESMEKIKRKPPQAPYYMNKAYYCERCDHEVEAGKVLPNSGRKNADHN